MSGLFGGGSSSQANNTSTSTTNNTTQDRRLVVDNGALGLSTDNSTVNLTMTDHGALQAANDLSKASVQTVGQNAALLIDAAHQLNQSGFDMLKANGDWAMHILDSASAQNQAAITTVANVVGKPLDMQDPKNILVAAGVVVVAVVAVAALKKG